MSSCSTAVRTVQSMPITWTRNIAAHGPRRATAADTARSFCRGLISPDCAFVSRYKFVVAKDGSKAWLTVDYNPTTLMVGNNVHPAAFIDPHTGVADAWPSSSWAAMTRAFRLGFEFLEAMSEPRPLFDADTKLVIERGDFHLVRVQCAATKAVTNVTDFLQVCTVIYGQTIARGKGIINNAKHLGLRFKPYAHPRPR